MAGRSKASALISVSLNIVYWKRDGSKVVFLVINDDDKLLIGNDKGLSFSERYGYQVKHLGEAGPNPRD